jgi:hypothetical protein
MIGEPWFIACSNERKARGLIASSNVEKGRRKLAADPFLIVGQLMRDPSSCRFSESQLPFEDSADYRYTRTELLREYSEVNAPESDEIDREDPVQSKTSNKEVIEAVNLLVVTGAGIDSGRSGE